MAFGSANAQHNGLTAREVLISGDYNGNPVPITVTSNGVLQVFDGSEYPIVGGGASSAVPVSVTSVALAAANANRIRLYFYNDGPNVAYLNHSASAVVATGQPLKVGGRLVLTGEDAKLAWNAICNTAESASIRVMTGTKS